LHQAVLDACGTLAGGQGDMLQDPRACHLDARTLVCAGADNADCLTAAQADVVNKLWRGPVDDHGNRLSAGDMPYGSELSWLGSMVPRDAAAVLSPSTSSDASYSFDFPNYMSSFGEPTGITYKNIQFTKQEFRKLHELSGLYDPTNPDLTRFARHGGKLLLWTGAADSGASPLMVLNYYDAVRRTMGEKAAATFLTLYLEPGIGHCGGRADYLTTVMKWTETGTAPGRVVVNYANGSAPAQTRPVFPYPNIAKYTGGDKWDAANYVESGPVTTFDDRTEWLGISHYSKNHTEWFVSGKAKLVPKDPSGYSCIDDIRVPSGSCAAGPDQSIDEINGVPAADPKRAPIERSCPGMISPPGPARARRRA